MVSNMTTQFNSIDLRLKVNEPLIKPKPKTNKKKTFFFPKELIDEW